MTERDLENLKDMPIPVPRDVARDAALRAALEVFDATDSALAAGSPQGEPQGPTKEPFKGNVVPFGQTETSEPKRRFFRMSFSSRSTQALAASIVALVIVAPVAFQELSKSGFNQTFRELQGDPRAGAAGRSAGYVAPQSGADVAIAKLPELAPVPSPAATPPAPPVAATAPAKTHSATPAKSPRDRIARQEKNKVAAVAANEPAPAAKSLDAVEAQSRSEDAKVAAKRPAATDRKKLDEIAQAPAAVLTAPVQPGAGGVRQNELAKGEATGGDTAVGGQISAGNAQSGADHSSTLVPQNGVTFDGGTMRPMPPPAPSPQPSIAALGDAAAPASLAPAKPDLNATTGRRMLESDKYAAEHDLRNPHDPYAWMGHADEQKSVVLEENRDRFDAKEINPVKQVASEPVSTFSIDVDTASYAFVRRALNAGHLPPKDAVRVEEMINYFPYAYAAPESAETPFKPSITVLPSPWNPSNKLVHVALRGYDLKSAERPRANLVFLMDVSGSMEPADRLPLVKNAFRMLVDELRPDDTIAIVTYASGSGIALEPTRVAEKSKIFDAIDRLGAGGSTAGAAGIADAYRLAESNFDKRAVNRVILATDGDFNVGITNQDELKAYIERKRQTGIFLSILGVGQGNHNDALMQTLAQNGNGTAAYADTLSEARKVLVEESSSTLFTIAKDVKIQIEWNPEAVTEYRLIGYETRNLKREDFNNDHVDAGDIGSGHTVTAVYEVTPVGAPRLVDDLRYAAKSPAVDTTAEKTKPASNELGFLKLRYKRPNEDASQLVTLPIADVTWTNIDGAPAEARFSVAVAAFGQLLKGKSYLRGFSYDDVIALAQSARGNDPFGYRAEFLNLVRLAKSARP